MEKKDIVRKVLCCLDEVHSGSVVNGVLDVLMDVFLEEAAMQVLQAAPLSAVGTFYDFSGAAVQGQEDGSGFVELPAGFVRLAAFRMSGWKRDAVRCYEAYDPVAQRQHNPYLRGGAVRPVVVRDGGRLYYYSVPEGMPHEIVRAEAVLRMPVGPGYPERLTDPLAWLAASKILDIYNEPQQADVARRQLAELMNNLKTS